MSNKVHVGNIEMEEGLSKTKWMVLEPSEKIKKIPKRLWSVGKEDPRRVIHAFKVGHSLTLVSLLYFMENLFKGIGSNAIWAVMTVVVVLLEFFAVEGLTISEKVILSMAARGRESAAEPHERNEAGNVCHSIKFLPKSIARAKQHHVLNQPY
ncbi:putative aluminum-activated malate transporter 11 [Arabidopsis thaliana]|uniref:Aluminum activated malate transporter family protein n=2 Tax=Arabidopsis TaxID=3701 RepID=A0A178UWN9_ARATH|nr:Aluminum-activated malate transporter [Arabidopsis thaliana x Arabidopsis arenosa]OAO97564.1 hypothetical protein AXX17_AT4G20670 [Arabidopsis thaliana]